MNRLHSTIGDPHWIACLIALFIPVSGVWGQTTMTSSGDWFTNSNWTNGVPNTLTEATILGTTADVNSQGAGTSVLLIRNGTVNVHGDGFTQDSASLGASDATYVGYVGNGNVDINGGGFLSTNNALIGFGEGFSGTVSIDGGAGSHWRNSGITTIGAYGFGLSTGNLSLANGALFENTGPSGTGILVGAGVSTGNVTINDSTLSSSNLLSVGHGGIGSLNVQNNSTVTAVTGVLGYGDGNTSSSTNSVGSANINNSSWHNSGELHIGWYAIGNLLGDGALITNTNGHIGYASSSIGMANLNSSVWLNSGSLNVGESGHGELLLQNGSQVSNTIGLIGTREGSYGKVTIDHSDWQNSDRLSIAEGVSAFPMVATTGIMNIINGGTVTSQFGVIANSDLTNGSVSVKGLNGNTHSRWTVNGELTIGERGTGQLAIESGGVVTCGTAYLGYHAGSSGILHLDGTAASRGEMYADQLNNGTGAGPGGGEIFLNGGILHANQSQPNFIRNFSPGSILIGANGVVFDTNGNDIGVEAPLQGIGGLSKTGLGTMNLSGTNLYAGETVVETGTLAINGSVAGDARIKNGAILGGTGTIGGTLTIEAGGILAPGNSPGTLNIDSVVWDAGGVMQFELGPTSDALNISANLLRGMGVGNYTFDFIDAGLVLNQTYDLMSFSNTDFAASDFSYRGASVPGGHFAFSNNQLHFTVSAVPEPYSTLLLSGLGLMTFVSRRRRCTAHMPK